MIKRVSELTEQDKAKYMKATEADFVKNYKVSWNDIVLKAQQSLDDAFDEDRFAQLKGNDRIDAELIRKAFRNGKPSLADYFIWMGTYMTHSDLVEIPD